MKKERTPKANHKHIYEECLYYEKEHEHYCRGEYCTVCGKIGIIHFFETVPSEKYSRCSKLLRSDEVKEKYKHLKTFNVESLLTEKHVEL